MVVTDDCKGFVVVTFVVLVVNVVFVDEAAVEIAHCKLVVVLGFDTVLLLFMLLMFLINRLLFHFILTRI